MTAQSSNVLFQHYRLVGLCCFEDLQYAAWFCKGPRFAWAPPKDLDSNRQSLN
jgi:hypothetical protein